MADETPTPPPPAQPDPATPPAEPPATPPAPPAPAPEEPLGPAGMSALVAERAAAAAAKAEAKALKDRLEALETANLSDQERAIAEARQAARAETLTEVNARLFTATAEGKAAGKVADPSLFTDPDVARKLLGFTDIPVTSDGGIDAEAISTAIDALVAAKPYLAASNGATPPKPTGSADGGARGGDRPAQLSRDDLKAMSHTQIEEARKTGRLDDLLSGNHR
jgi:hypothetical protein